MKSKYIAALSAGIVGGVLLAAYAVLLFAVELVAWYGYLPGTGATALCGCLFYVYFLVIGLLTGVLAVMWAKGVLAKLVDAIIISALAGALAGLIYGVINVVIAFIRPLIESYAYLDSSSYAGGLALGSMFGAGSGVLACLCAPVWLIAVAIVAAIGGAVYAVVKLKLQ